MLDSLPPFAERLLSSIADLMSHVTAASPLRPRNAQIRPQDPSTLTLAVVGIVTLALYFAVSGWRKSRLEQRASRPGSEASVEQLATDRTETPKRGAA
jgi:hypothetical protein